MNRKFLSCVGVLLFGLVTTFLAGILAEQHNNQTIRTAVADQANELAKRVSSILSRYEYGLRGVRGAVLTTGPDNLNAEQFLRYSQSRDLAREFPGARGFGVIRRVTTAQEKNYPALMRLHQQAIAAIPGFHQSHPEHYIIQFIEPRAANAKALGLDIAAEPRRYQAASKAASSGQATLTAPITLVQASTKPQQSFLFLLPIYAGAFTPATVAARRQQTIGWSYAPLSIADVLDAVGLHRQREGVSIRDVTDGSAGGPFYQVVASPEAGLQYRHQVMLPIYGRSWQIDYEVYPAFVRQLPLWSLGAIHAVGTLGSVIAAILCWVFLESRGRRQDLEKTRNQLSAIVDHSVDGIIGKTIDGQVISWNKGAESIFGYSANEALGRSVTDLIVPAERRQEEADILASIARGERFAATDTVWRHKDGHLIDVSVAVSPIRDESGCIIGAAKTVRDITLQKAAAASLAAINQRLEAEVASRTDALRLAEQMLRTVLDGLPSMIGYWDKNLVNRVANRAYETWFGVDSQSIAGMRLPDLLGPALYAQNQPYIEQVLAGAAQTFERDIAHPNGTVRHALAHYLPDWVDGSVRGFFVIVHDITELVQNRQQLTQALQENASLMSAINGQLLYAMLDKDGVFLEVNDKFCALHGYPKANLLGQPYQRVLAAEQDRQAIWRLLSAGQSWQGELQTRARDGTACWFDSVIAPLGNAADDKAQYMLLMIDTTERRQAEAEARRLTMLLQQVLDSASEVSVIATELDGTIKVFNKGAERMLGYAAADMIGKQTPAIIHLPSEVEARAEELTREFGVPVQGFRAFVHKAEFDGAERREWTYLRQNGERLTVSLAVTALQDHTGQVNGYLGVATDITAMRRQQNELAAARDQLLLAAEVANLGVWSWEIQQNRLTWNEQMFQMYDQPLALMAQGLNYGHWVERVHPDDVMAAEGALIRAMASDELYAPLFRVVHRDGSVHDIQAGAFVEKDPAGNVLRVIGVNFDITERKQFERHLLDAKLQAEQANKTKGQFLANMSHEIRTPLNAVLGMLELLQHSTLSERQADYARKAQVAAQSLLGLLNDILDFSKIEAGKLLLDQHAFSLDQLMRDLGVVLAANVGNKPVEVLFDMDTAIPAELYGDSLRLQQVLINLAGNAIKFTERGQVLVSVRMLPGGDSGHQLRFTISDTGIGISPEQQARIFEGFTQAEAATSRRYGGTGLGLVICQRLVALMGGELALESEYGRGSQFYFTLSFEAGSSVDAVSAEVAHRLGHTPSVLVVDDNDDALRIFAAMVEALGWNSQTASSGEEAITLLQQHQLAGGTIDFMLLDWRMPEMDGLTLASMLPTLLPAGSVPTVLMCTAFSPEALADKHPAADKPYAGVLVKPFTPAQFIDAVNQGVGLPAVLSVEDRLEPVRSQKLSGLRILVVEDNVLNQQVAAGLLRSVGAEVQLADGGREGVRLAATMDYDVIMMDMQMPDCDGLEATRLIRARPGGQSLPIIAMTANASQEDRETCLAAGMNDFISKPINLAQLVTCILTVLSGQPPPAAALPVLSDAAPDHSDTEPWQDIMSRFGDNRDAYRAALAVFLPEANRLLDSLHGHIGAMNWGAARRDLHTIKGVAATVGAVRLAALAARLEEVLKTEPGGLHVGDLAVVKEAAVRAAAMLDAQSVASSPPVRAQASLQLTDSEWRTGIQAVRALLQVSNMSALDEMAALQSATPTALSAWADHLMSKIEQLQFQAALVEIDRYLDEEGHG